MNHAVALVLEGSANTKKIFELLDESLAPLKSQGVVLDVLAFKAGFTAVMQGDGGHGRYWSEIELFAEAAAASAREFKTRTWLLYGYGGSADELFCTAFAADGAVRWKKTNQRAEKSFNDDLGLKDFPFISDGNEFLEPWPPHRDVATYKAEPAQTWASLPRKQLLEVAGIKVPSSAPGWGRTERHGEHPVEHVLFDLGTAESGALQVPEGLSSERVPRPPFVTWGSDAHLQLPDGFAGPVFFSSEVTGFPHRDRGNAIDFRWGLVFHLNERRWLWVARCVGPWKEARRAEQEVLKEARAKLERERAEESLSRAVARSDLKGVRAGLKVLLAAQQAEEKASPWGGRVVVSKLAAANLVNVVRTAVEDRAWKIFDALRPEVRRSDAAALQEALDNSSDWKQAVKRGASAHSLGERLHEVESLREAKELIAAGADVDAVDGYGASPLHHVENGAIALELVKAGADLSLPYQDRTPLESYLRSFSLAAPDGGQVKVMLEMLKRGAEPRGRRLEKALTVWKKTPAHEAAKKRLLSA